MSNSSTGTLILATLLSTLGWLGVTLYGISTDNRGHLQKVDLRVNTLEVTPMEPSMKEFLALKANVEKARRDLEDLEDVVRDLDHEVEKLYR